MNTESKKSHIIWNLELVIKERSKKKKTRMRMYSVRQKEKWGFEDVKQKKQNT